MIDSLSSEGDDFNVSYAYACLTRGPDPGCWLAGENILASIIPCPNSVSCFFLWVAKLN